MTALLAVVICIESLPTVATTAVPNTDGVALGAEIADGPERCRRLSGIGGSVLGGFASEAYEVETERFVNGVQILNEPFGAEFAAPMRDFAIDGPEPKAIVLPDNFGYQEFGEVWRWTARSVPGLTVHISLPDPLLQGSAYDRKANPLPRQPFNDAQRDMLAHLVGESIAVLPQVALASLPPTIHVIVLENLYNDELRGEEVAAMAAYPVHHTSDAQYSVLLNVANGWGVPLQGGHFFDLGSGASYAGLNYHRESRFEELLLHEFAHVIDDFYQVTQGVYWVDDAGTAHDGWWPNPVARWWDFRQRERESSQEFVTTYAATSVAENFAETFVAWAALRSGRLNPYKSIGNVGCSVPEHINTKMPLELEWWDRQGLRAMFSIDGALFACEPYLDTDFGGFVRVDLRPEGEEPAPMPCSDMVEFGGTVEQLPLTP